MLVSIGLLLWNFVSFLPKTPMSPATYLLLGGGPKEIIHPLDLQINYATAYMFIREGHPDIRRAFPLSSYREISDCIPIAQHGISHTAYGLP